jgi:hypothetical protein
LVAHIELVGSRMKYSSNSRIILAGVVPEMRR